jgi:hypothetical protein
MKIYRGTRTNGVARVVVIDGPKSYELDPRLGLRNHSPDGFEWGSGGNGAAQLALAILADHFRKDAGGDHRALALYQQFKQLVVALLPREGFTLTEDEVARQAGVIERGEFRA